MTTKHRKLDIPMETIATNLGIRNSKVLEATLNATTQLASRDGLMPIHKRYKTRQTALKYRRLGALQLYSDTLVAPAKMKSFRGKQYAQVFTSGEGLSLTYPMRHKSEAFKGLNRVMQKWGIPGTIVTDNAFEEVVGQWGDICSEAVIEQKQTEPHSPWQNRAETEIKELKKEWSMMRSKFKVPANLWCVGLTHLSKLRMKRSHLTERGDSRTAWEVVTGDTPDISEFIYFHFYQPVTFYDPVSFPDSKDEIGRWIGSSENVGQALCCRILTSKGAMLDRSTVSPLDMSKKENIGRLAEYDKDLHANIGCYEDNPELTTVETDPDAPDAQEPGQHWDVEENDLLSDGMIGAELYMSRGGKLVPATVKARKRDIDGTLIGTSSDNPRMDSRVYQVEYEDGHSEAYIYNTILENLHSQVDEDGHRYWIFSRLIDHRRDPKAGTGKTKGWELEVEWKDGTTSWETLSALKESNMAEVAKYAVDNGLRDEKAFKFWVTHALKKYDRIIKTAKRRKQSHKYKYGIEVPTTYAGALELDRKIGNNMWRRAIEKEMNALSTMDVFKVLKRGERAPPNYKQVPLLLKFDVKMDLTRKARMCAGGHVTDPPTTDTYSGVVERESVRLAFLLAGANAMEVCMSDIGNAYVHAKTHESVFAIATAPFGEDEGCIAIIVKALYGLKTSGAAWHAFLADTLIGMGYTPCRADTDVWMKRRTKPTGDDYWEYLLVYTDDILCVSHDARDVMVKLEQMFKLKGGIGEPTTYLGATIGKHKVQGTGQEFWCMSSTAYLKEAIRNIEQKGGKLTSKDVTTPTAAYFHPELDESEFLNDDDHTYYQSLIGVLQWLSELGRIDITFATSSMAKFSASPRTNHLTYVLRIFSYLKTHDRSRVVFDYEKRDWSNRDFTDYDWKGQYPGQEDESPPGMPEPLGKSVQINFFCDAAHAQDLLNRRSQTGILIFVNGSPIKWYSKRQNTVEASAYGSEYTALRIAGEMIEALRYKLRMLGVALDGPANGFVDNESVVFNTTIPSSCLKKKHNSTNYHKTRELVAQGVMRICHEPGVTNSADVLTKGLSGPHHKKIMSQILH